MLLFDTIFLLNVMMIYRDTISAMEAPSPVALDAMDPVPPEVPEQEGGEEEGMPGIEHVRFVRVSTHINISEVNKEYDHSEGRGVQAPAVTVPACQTGSMSGHLQQLASGAVLLSQPRM